MSDMIERAAVIAILETWRPHWDGTEHIVSALAALPAQPAQGEADRAEIERLQKKRVEDAAFLNSQMQRAEAAEARLTALEADRVKVAETALRMTADAVEDHATGGVHYEYGHDDASMRVAIRSAILAITPAAVLTTVDSTCNAP